MTDNIEVDFLAICTKTQPAQRIVSFLAPLTLVLRGGAREKICPLNQNIELAVILFSFTARAKTILILHPGIKTINLRINKPNTWHYTPIEKRFGREKYYAPVVLRHHREIQPLTQLS
ncbi:MAG: hypothetical protein WC295_00725 [Methanoregula sp.]|jgi:hypothetical protein